MGVPEILTVIPAGLIFLVWLGVVVYVLVLATMLVRAVVRIDGEATGADGAPGFDVTVRIYAHAGASWLRIFLTLTNRIPRRRVRFEEFRIDLEPRIEGDLFRERLL